MEGTIKPVKRLYRSQVDKIIFGVCGGLGEYFNIDPVIFRVIFVVLAFNAGAGVLIYVILTIITKKNPNQILIK